MRFTVDQKVLQDVLNFLATQPYKDTAILINSLQQDAKPVEEIKPIVEVVKDENQA